MKKNENANKKSKPDSKPCIEQSEAYMQAFDYFNKELFDSKIKRPMLYLTRNSTVIGGYCDYEKWRDEDGNRIHEIAINANMMSGDDVVLLMRILIHEMIHLLQYQEKTAGRKGYHNQDFADRAKAIGMIPRDQKTGKEVGQMVDTPLEPGGLASKAIADIPDEAIFPWMADNTGSAEPQESGGGKAAPPQRSGVRAKFTCALCGLNAWAKAGARLGCVDCDRVMVEQVKG